MYIGNIEALKKILSNICAMLSSAHSNEDVFKDALERELQDMYKFTDDSFSLNPIHLYDKYHLAIRPREGAWVVNAEGHRVKDPVDVALIAVKAIRIMLAKAARNEAERSSAFAMGSCACGGAGINIGKKYGDNLPEEEKDPTGFVRKVLEEMFNVNHANQEAKEAFSEVIDRSALCNEIEYLIGIFCNRFIAPGQKASIQFSGFNPIFVRFVPSHNLWTIDNRKEVEYSEELKNKLLAHLNGAEV